MLALIHPPLDLDDQALGTASEVVGDPVLASAVQVILERLGEDVGRDGLQKTPERAARALAFLTRGYRQSLRDAVGDALFDVEFDELVVVKDIEFHSLCEHHMLPFSGRAHVAYLPGGRVVGLSKLPRIVDMFARRLQVQERMTTQIADAIVEILEPQGVAVVLEASHMCMQMRGVEKQGSTTLTSSMRGVFRNDPARRAEVQAHLASRPSR